MLQNVRLAALQFSSGLDTQKNLDKILEMLEKAQSEKPHLVVLPEFCNHASWYDSQEHCYEVAVDINGNFIKEIGKKARDLASLLVCNVTLRKPQKKVTASSLLFSPEGAIIGVSDKQVLMGHENFFLSRASEAKSIYETTIGRLGLYACMDGVIPETTRCLALQGAQILCNSLNSFAKDEAALHVPVRAAENRVFVVAANKVGPLVPLEHMEEISKETKIPEKFLWGAGESQIIAPDGTILAKASQCEDELIFADCNIRQADTKIRPDGNHILKNRRPQLYSNLCKEPEKITHHEFSKKISAAVWQASEYEEAGIDDLCANIQSIAEQVHILTLPELFFMKSLTDVDRDHAERLSQMAIAKICESTKNCRNFFIVGSFLSKDPGSNNLSHNGILISRHGVIFSQEQLHRSKRYPELQLGSAIRTYDLNFGRIAIVVGEDSLYPEVFRVLAAAGVDLVLIPMDLVESWEAEYGLKERAAENRICLVACSRPNLAGASFFASLEKDFTLLTPWETRVFDGNINVPLWSKTPRFPGFFKKDLHLSHSHNKILSAQTNLINSRPWNLSQVIASSYAT